jgi:hypothetical protein
MYDGNKETNTIKKEAYLYLLSAVRIKENYIM